MEERKNLMLMAIEADTTIKTERGQGDRPEHHEMKSRVTVGVSEGVISGVFERKCE